MSLMKSFLLSVALVLAATVFCAAADGSAAPLLADAVAEEFAVEVAVPDSVAPSTTTTTTTTASPAAGDKHRRTLSSSLSGPVCYHDSSRLGPSPRAAASAVCLALTSPV